ncbi:alpha,alpha-phosphotrehalase [Bifidobacterium tsurumiense]|uniref:alpha,alpha-phosphotrehalase n=1 Tax=Bifidobacterium tsurumiense TaxID=356829 RepID=UPI0012B35667|nr:alpha,alpha-phosphotrehalase [Bifidobacterium tsurumiense]MDY4678192.1 alpha,alpha-phosphotrehalase [Bifidobacterium tsurumiense]MSS12249.1 alpha,alpha-phosphotrehalase [Bifidobacterium tsurumiense]
MTHTTDFRKATMYQIYPESFRDSNGDGLGDLNGVIEKLDYLADLGVDYLWLTPFFVSPQKDNGYDVADYTAVDPAYGTMEDCERLIAEADKRGLGLMFDMVFNHVSTEHEWFKRALAGDQKYKDFFFFRKGKGPGEPPTNWRSKFGGSAWQYVPEFDEWYLHVFDPTQADLNWENPAVREAVADVLRFWMEKGVKGFRFDVINLISKMAFEDDNEFDGRRFYTDGPKVHEYLKELNARTFGKDPGIITVGEMNSTSLESCTGYAGRTSGELNMVFSFHHLKVDFAGREKWVLVPTDFAKLKEILFDWQIGMTEHDAWNALFWCCHDQPRVVSRFGTEDGLGDSASLWAKSAKMLATITHCLRGTPYVYQGEELGMTNTDFTSIDQFRDVESLNNYQILLDKGMPAKDAIRIVQVHSRDNARTPMQWDDSAFGGFMDADATAKPWIGVNANHVKVNAAAQVGDLNSVRAYYKDLIALRKRLDVIAEGSIEPLAQDHEQVFAYRRELDGHELIVANNFYARDCDWAEAPSVEGFKLVLSNYAAEDGDSGQITASPAHLRPYEAQVWYR